MTSSRGSVDQMEKRNIDVLSVFNIVIVIAIMKSSCLLQLHLLYMRYCEVSLNEEHHK